MSRWSKVYLSDMSIHIPGWKISKHIQKTTRIQHLFQFFLTRIRIPDIWIKLPFGQWPSEEGLYIEFEFECRFEYDFRYDFEHEFVYDFEYDFRIGMSNRNSNMNLNVGFNFTLNMGFKMTRNVCCNVTADVGLWAELFECPHLEWYHNPCS